MKKLTNLLLFVFFLKTIPTSAQPIAWSPKVDSTYVFEIGNKDAEKFLRGKVHDTTFVKMLRKPTAAFVSEWKNRPKQGHFIFADISKSQVAYTYNPIFRFRFFCSRNTAFSRCKLLTKTAIFAAMPK